MLYSDEEKFSLPNSAKIGITKHMLTYVLNSIVQVAKNTMKNHFKNINVHFIIYIHHKDQDNCSCLKSLQKKIQFENVIQFSR